MFRKNPVCKGAYRACRAYRAYKAYRAYRAYRAGAAPGEGGVPPEGRPQAGEVLRPPVEQALAQLQGLQPAPAGDGRNIGGK